MFCHLLRFIMTNARVLILDLDANRTCTHVRWAEARTIINCGVVRETILVGLALELTVLAAVTVFQLFIAEPRT